MNASNDQSLSGRVRTHIRANIYGLIAIFIALGGTSYAATQIEKNSVGTKAIKKSAVTNKKLAANAVTGAKVTDGSLTGTDIDLSTLGIPTNAGDITGVSAGDGLTGGGAAGDVTVGADPTVLQQRVGGTCAVGSAVRAVAQNGNVTCQSAGMGDITGVSVSGGLTGGGATGDVNVGTDPTVLQQRVSGTCAAGTAVTGVAQNGTVTCSSSFAPAGQLLTSGQKDVSSFPNVSLLQAGGITIATACEAFAGEADATIAVNSGTVSFVGDTPTGVASGHQVATSFPSGGSAVIARTTSQAQLSFTAVTSAGKTLNGSVYMSRNGPGSCTYEASGISGG